MENPHIQPAEQVLKGLRSSEEGLNAEEINLRLSQFGANELKEKKKDSALTLFLGQFKEVMIIILMAAALLSGIMGDMTDAAVILVIVLLNALVGFIQEYRAEKALDALRKMAVMQAHVVRNNQSMMVSSSALVPGDIVLLEAGNGVPADMRLISAHNLRIDESSLTGESVAVDKHCETLNNPELPPADRINMAFKGTLVTHGRATAVVTATGMQTELGKIAGMLQEKGSMTPLQVRMAHFGKKLSYIILIICAILFASGVIRGENPYTLLLLSVSLAVAAIPEALPALITIALSRGASRLVKQKALVRKLPAVETLGSVTFICSDKTGTLTQNQMRVVDRWNASSDSLPSETPEMQSPPVLLLGMALNHDVKLNEDGRPFGESTELAMVESVIDELGLEEYYSIMSRYPRMAELPFDSDRKCMTTVHQFGGKLLVLTKGAAESIADALSGSDSAQILRDKAEQRASDGKRVLAFAYKVLDELPEPFDYKNIEHHLQLAGLVSLIDPPRPEAAEAIAECKAAGIKPVMITGDHPATAKAIAREIGILQPDDLCLTGAELLQLSDEAFRNQVLHTAVYARVSPDQKLRIVRMLQSKGHFIAMTGDGVNDAPSLKAANIGVAMGINGTDVSKEASDLVLLDDNFATIVKAVKEGRRIFDNIRKFVKYIMTCNGAEIWTIFLAPILGMPIPLLPIHILWINLVTDGLPALALAGEKSEADIMQRPPRSKDESLFSDGVGYHIVWVGVLMAGVTLAMQAWSMHHELEHWQTMVFTVLSLSQLGHVLAVRSDRTFLYRQGFLSNHPLLFSVLITFLLQLCVIYLPAMNSIFKTQPLTLNELLLCIAAAIVVFHAVECEKWIKNSLRNAKIKPL